MTANRSETRAKQISSSTTLFTSNLSLAAITVLVLAFVAATFMRNSLWHTPVLIWQDASSKSPLKGQPYHQLGDWYAQQHDPEQAFYYYRKTRAVDPDYFASGLSYARERRGDGSPSTLKEKAVHEYSPSSLKALSAANEYVRLGRLDDAIVEYTSVLAENPRQAVVLNKLGIIYYQKGLLDEAIRQFSKAIAADEGFYAGYSNLGFVYFKLGSIDKAMESLQQAVKLEPRDPEPYAKLGLVYLKLGKAEDAITQFQNSLALNPRNALALENIETARGLLR